MTDATENTYTVDRIAEIAADIAELSAEKKQLIDKLKAKGDGEYYGTSTM